MTEELAGGKLRLDEPAEAVARLTLSRPEARNALDQDVLDAIAEAMPRLDRGIEVRCVLITGAGKAFSAGYDIAAIPRRASSGTPRPSSPTPSTRRWRRWRATPGRWSPRSTATPSVAASS